MAQFGPRQAGEPHEACPKKTTGEEGGVLTLHFEERRAGENTRGVIGNQVYIKVLAYLRCDVCSALYGVKDQGRSLVDYCRRLAKGFESQAEKPVACPHCPAGKGRLTDAYRNSARDNFSLTPKRHGTSYLLCARCGQLAWVFEHSAEEDRRVQAQLEELFPMLKKTS